MRSAGILLSPRVRGIAGFTSAMTVRAASAAAFVTSTEIPRLHVPSGSGGATWTSATSGRRRPLRSSRGTSGKETGTYSTRPVPSSSRMSLPT